MEQHGQVLTTNGSGTLSFQDASAFVSGDAHALRGNYRSYRVVDVVMDRQSVEQLMLTCLMLLAAQHPIWNRRRFDYL